MASIRHPIELDGKTYQVSPLSDAALQSLDLWVREKFVERNQAMLQTAPDKEIAYSVLMQQAAALTWNSSFGARLMGSIEGVAKLLYEGLHPNHPDLTEEDVRKLVFSPEHVAKANRAFQVLNLGQEPKVKPKRKRRRSNKKKST